MVQVEYDLELTGLALGNWVELPDREDREAVDRKLRAIVREPRGPGALAEAGREEYRVRTEGVLIRYAVDDERHLVTVLRIRPL